jgi:hypothetical protein
MLKIAPGLAFMKTLSSQAVRSQLERLILLECKRQNCGTDFFMDVSKLLKGKSGRPGSNRRRPAWENAGRLKTENNRVYDAHSSPLKSPNFRHWLRMNSEWSTYGVHDVQKSTVDAFLCASR